MKLFSSNYLDIIIFLFFQMVVRSLRMYCSLLQIVQNWNEMLVCKKMVFLRFYRKSLQIDKTDAGIYVVVKER